MKKPGSCNNCVRGIKININKDILCKIHGIVSRDFRCAKYIRRVETWSSFDYKPKCIECEFFISAQDEPANSPDEEMIQQPLYEAEQDQSMGYCQLFTVRQFDGERKTACSKFCQRSERNIS